VSLKSAKKEGMLFLFADSAHQKIVKTSLYFQLVFGAFLMCLISWKTAGLVLAAALLSFWYYAFRTKKEFGGITGDMAGWFVTVCEGAMAVAAAAASHLWVS
jgi:adenosylcobinamide-GDP ribazoletransferase